MNCIQMTVPRMLTNKHYLPHPEFYGELMVIILNGMVTDIYTGEQGELFTMTNNSKFMECLKNNQIEQVIYRFEDGYMKLRSETMDDIKLIY